MLSTFHPPFLAAAARPPVGCGRLYFNLLSFLVKTMIVGGRLQSSVALVFPGINNPLATVSMRALRGKEWLACSLLPAACLPPCQLLVISSLNPN
jgi:hypothetical protein